MTNGACMGWLILLSKNLGISSEQMESELKHYTRSLTRANGRGSEPPSHGRGGGAHMCPLLTRKLRNASTSGKKHSTGLNKL